MPEILDVTGAMNRAAFDARLTAERHALRSTGAPAALIVFDVDGLDAIAQTYGPARADDVLHGVAARLRERHRCWPYRVGHNLFAVLLTGGDEAAGAQLGEIVRASVAIRPIGGLTITVSVGVAASPAGWGWDDPTLGARADAELHRAHAKGGDVTVAHEAGVVTPADERTPRLLAPRAAVTHELASWWSTLTQRGHSTDEPAPGVTAPEPSTVAAGHPVIDDPTQSLTRDALAWHAAELAARAAQNRLPVALVLADLDDADVRARFGATAGEEILRVTADRIETATSTCPYRAGDDTFAVLLVGDDARRAFAVAERMRAAVAAVSAGSLRVSASVGVATSPPGVFSLADLEARATRARRDARAGGGNQVQMDGVPAAPAPTPVTRPALRAA